MLKKYENNVNDNEVIQQVPVTLDDYRRKHPQTGMLLLQHAWSLQLTLWPGLESPKI